MPTLAVWKFASCDGCQLTLLDCEDELLAVAGRVRIAHFLEATRRRRARPVRRVAGRGLDHHAAGRGAHPPGPRRCRAPWSPSAPAPPRAACRRCATSPTSTSSARSSTPGRSTSSTLATSTPIAAHVTVDFELHGCPIDRRQLLEVITALLVGPQARHPRAQRLLRVQAARQRLRGRGARHAVPRPGHPRRLRRAVPGATSAAATAASARWRRPTPPAQAGLLRATGMSEARRRAGATARSTPTAFIELSRVTVGPPPAAALRRRQERP